MMNLLRYIPVPLTLYSLTLFLVSSLSLQLNGQANPTNSNNQLNMNSQVNYDLSLQYTLLMDPMLGYGGQESATNFAARNYWEKYCAANPNDESAWFYYYESTRFIAEGSAGFTELQSDLDSISNHLKKHSSGTWEQLIVEYWNSNRDPKKEPVLVAASKLRPDDPLTLRFMAGMQYLQGKQALVYDSYVEWRVNGALPVSTETYAFNVMQSLPKDAVLITNGEMDTYPLLYQMQTIGMSTIKVVSIAMCSRPENRTRVFTYAGISVPDNDLKSAIDGDYIARIVAANPGKKIYVAATCGPEILRPISEKLYCTGLAYRYSETPVENLNFLRDNVGTKFRLDNIGKAVKSTNRFDVFYADNLEMNYYLPLLMAADGYVQAGNAARAAQLRLKAKTIRERAGYDEPLRSEE